MIAANANLSREGDETVSINEKLPVELHHDILSKVDPDSLFAARNACQLWRDIVDDIIGVDLHIGSPDLNIWKTYNNTGFKDVEAISLFGVKRCFISGLPVSAPVASGAVGDGRPGSETLEWKVPDRLQYLWIDGFISWTTFNRLTLQLSRLRKLEVHFTTLASLPAGEIAKFKMDGLVNLESLAIRMFSVDKVHLKSISKGLVNAFILLSTPSVVFPRLVEASFSFPLAAFSDLLSRAVCRFLGRHTRTIRKFSLHYNRHSTSGAGRFGLGLALDLPITELRSYNLRLESVDIGCISAAHRSMTVFEDLVNEQRDLKILHSFIRYPPPDLAFHAVERCSRTLTTVQLCVKSGFENHVGVGPYRPFTLTPFVRCVNLKILELIGQEQFTMGDRSNATPDLEFTSALPPSLRVLTLVNFLILSRDCSHLITNKPALEKLRIINAGTSSNMGFSFESLLKIVRERKPANVVLRNSMNFASVYEATQSDDPNLYVPASMLHIANLNWVPLRFANGKFTTAKDARVDSENYPTETPRVVIPLTGYSDFFIDEDDVTPYASDDEAEAGNDNGGPGDDGEGDESDNEQDEGHESDGSVYEPGSDEEDDSDNENPRYNFDFDVEDDDDF